MKFLTHLFAFAVVIMLPSCALDSSDEREVFYFPDANQGDTLDDKGMWHGRRDWTGKIGAKVRHAPGACLGRSVKFHQHVDDTFYGTNTPVPNSGYFDFSVQGPCKEPYKLTIIPKDENP